MKRHLIKGAILAVIFVVSVIVISELTNKGNTDMTAEMANATYPVVTTMVGDMEVNTLHGYTDEMEAKYMRDTITPLQEDRKLTIHVKGGTFKINRIGYEVRSLDTTRLVEDNEVANLMLNGEDIQAQIPIKDLIDEDTEYVLTIVLKGEKGKEIRYYTRIILTENLHLTEQINFTRDLQNKIYNRDKTYSEDIVKYLESNASGDNSSFHKVDIHSSLEQVTWGNLGVKIESESMPQIKELSDSVATIFYDYMVSITGDDGQKEYLNVEEYYYVRYTANRMYLLDYERFANEIFTPAGQCYDDQDIVLGITGEDVELKENLDGTIVSFIQENTLWQYNNNSDRIVKVFGFFNNDMQDLRDNYDQHKIKIVSMDDSGNMQFMVYGYMNRGLHEGECGVAMYYYDSVINCIEEEVFLPYTKPYQMLKEDVKHLSYVNGSNEMFIFLQDTVYKIDLFEHTYEKIVSGLSDGTYTISADNSMLAWQEELEENKSKTIQVLSLADGISYQVTAEAHDYVKPLGFIEKDFIYGISRESDIKAGAVEQFPMYAVNICNEEGTEIQYQKDGIYILDTTLKGNVIQLTRVKKGEAGNYIEVENDSIMNNSPTEASKVSVVTKVFEDNREKEVCIRLGFPVGETKPKLLTPRQVIFQESRTVDLKDAFTETDREYYFVYARYGLMGVHTDVSLAIANAKECSGVVLNKEQNYIWEKTKRKTKNTINVGGTDSKDGSSSLSICLTELLKAGGYTVDAKPMLEQGESSLSILERYVEGDTLDLTGLSVDNVLYYVSRGYPVMAILGDNQGVLIVGYDEFNVIIMDPANGGMPYKKGLNDSIAYFEGYGNKFLSFVE